MVEHGLFIGMAEAVVIGRADGGAEVIRRPGAAEPVDVEELMRNEDA